MRLIPAILALLVSLPAYADGRLKLTSDRPIMIIVNMVPHTIDADSPAIIDYPRGKEGTQRITVRNLAGQVMHTGQVIVAEGEVVVVGWVDKEFKVLERKQLKTSPQYNRRAGKRGVAGHKRLDKLSAEEPIATDLLSLAASGNSTPAPEPTVTTEPEPEPADQVTVEGDGSSTEGAGTAETVEAKTIAGDGATATVKLYPRTQSWANVWIDGERVWEFRAKSDVLELTIPAGTHTVTVKDFRDKNLWGSGTLTVSPGESASLQFSMADPIEVTGGAWAPE